MITQTGIKDKTHLFQAIQTLENAKLVKRFRIRTTKQKKLLVIEKMGRDLVNLMNNIDEFRKSFRSLTKTIDEYFNLEEGYVMLREVHRQLSKEEETGITQEPSEKYRASKKSLRNKLRAKYWTDEEIDSHYLSTHDADVFYMSSAQAFISGLFNKYLSLSLRRGSTEISRAILTKIIIDSLNQHVFDVYKVLLDVNVKSLHHNGVEDSDSAYMWLVFSLNPQIRDYLKEFSEEDTVRANHTSLPPTFNFVPRIKNRFLQKEVTEVMRSITNMYEFDYKWLRDL